MGSARSIAASQHTKVSRIGARLAQAMSTDRVAPDRVELTFTEIALIGVRYRWLLVSVLASIVLLAVLYLHFFASFQYGAELRVTPVERTSGGLSSQLSGLASFAGMELAQQEGVSPYALFVEGIRSGNIASEMANKPGLLQSVFSDQWNTSSEQWVRPSGVGKAITRTAKSLLGYKSTSWSPPNEADLRSYIVKHVRVTQRPGDPTATIQFNHASGEFARAFVSNLHQSMDEFLRQRTLRRTEKYVAYLTEKLASVSIAEHRQALADALSEQERARMMAQSDLPFAAEPFGTIKVSADPVSPQPLVVIFAAGIFGLLLAAAIIAVLLATNRGSRTVAVAD